MGESLAAQIAVLLRTFYVTSAVSILVVLQIPVLRDRFLNYGARSQTRTPQKTNPHRKKWLDMVENLTVPHSWFFHFYLISVCCSAYWIFQVRTGGYALQMIGGQSADYAVTTVYEQRVMLCMVFMLVQGMRRLYECLFVTRASKSQMWIGHYLVGIAFYLTINVAIWIDAVPVLRKPNSTIVDADVIATPSETVRTTLCIVAFAVFSLAQYQVHSHLADLQKYTLPAHALFTSLNVITPHYFFEVGIYVTFAFLTAPEGAVLNSTISSAVLFVLVNLGVTASGTREWYVNKFPKRKAEILRRKRMIPLVW